MSKSINQWKANRVTLQQGQAIPYNASSEQTNIFQIINRVASGGGVVFVDTEPSVSPTSYQLRVDQGSSQNLVLPYEAKVIYLCTDSVEPLPVTVVEINSDEILFTFGAAQLVNISGNVQVQEPVTVDGTVNISGDVEIKNDSGNPIPVNGTVSVAESLYQSMKVTALGDTVVKVGSGQIIGIKSDGVAMATIRDNVNELWSTSGESHFTAPLQCVTNITINLSQVGTCYVLYK